MKIYKQKTKKVFYLFLIFFMLLLLTAIASVLCVKFQEKPEVNKIVMERLGPIPIEENSGLLYYKASYERVLDTLISIRYRAIMKESKECYEWSDIEEIFFNIKPYTRGDPL